MSAVDDDEVQAVMVDCGSGVFKAGLAGDDEPSLVFPTYVGQTRTPGIEGFLVGNECGSRDDLILSYPMEHGIVSDWESMEQVLSYTFKTLGRSPEVHPILISQSPLNPTQNGERMLQVMFEKLNTSRLCSVNHGLLCTYATGRGGGIVVDIGDGVCYTYPFYQAEAYPHAIKRNDFAGRDLTDYLLKLLQQRGYFFSTSFQRNSVRKLKESLCYVSQNVSLEVSRKVSHTLSSGEAIELSSERYLCPEALFQPSLAGSTALSLPDMVLASVRACDIDIRRHMLNNVCLCGGSSLFEGVTDRLQMELSARVSPSERVKVVAMEPGRELATWTGGSILASLSSFQDKWISKQDYQEQGSRMLLRSQLYYQVPSVGDY